MTQREGYSTSILSRKRVSGGPLVAAVSASPAIGCQWYVPLLTTYQALSCKRPSYLLRVQFSSTPGSSDLLFVPKDNTNIGTRVYTVIL